MSLMFRLMVVWLRIRFLVLLLLGLGFLLVSLFVYGLSGLGGMLMMVYREVVLFLPVVGIVLCLVLYSLFRGLSYGVSFLLCSPLVVCIWVLITSIVVRHVGRMLDGCFGAQPFDVLKDGDLLFLIHRMLQLRGLDTVRISKVKGHASEDMVVHGRVRDLDRLGNKAG